MSKSISDDNTELGEPMKDSISIRKGETMECINSESTWGVDLAKLTELIRGKTISKIRMSNSYLVIEFGNEYVSFTVEGDCCSSSYFFDIFGGHNLVGKKVVEITDIDLQPTDLKITRDDYGEIKVYGYKIVCEPNDDYFDTSNTAVFSFRNSSNGYYGGSINFANIEPETIPEVAKDIYKVG